MVQSLVREHCRTNAIKPDSEEAHDVAREPRKWFAGVTDRNHLRKLLASSD
nr:hypothetical protein [Rhizobium leguminosarum]